MMSNRKLRMVLFLTALCVAFTASESDAFGQWSGCASPSVKAPPGLARQLVHRVLKWRYSEPYDHAELLYEQAKLLHRRGGVSGLFCADTLHLNENGKPNLLLITLADVEDAVKLMGANNGPVWVYRRTSQGYQLLLEASAEGAGDIEVLKTSTGGYRDIKTRALESAVEHDIIIYKFDGRRYRPRECMTEAYTGDKQGGDKVKYERWNCKEAGNGYGP